MTTLSVMISSDMSVEEVEELIDAISLFKGVQQISTRKESPPLDPEMLEWLIAVEGCVINPIANPLHYCVSCGHGRGPLRSTPREAIYAAMGREST